ncbi:MAG: toprim domain-containing protein [Rhizobiales bacterium]|nr:toprim domain-containing protein [Hyphomicrobiales bacterium]
MIDLNDAPPQRAPASHYDLDAIVARLRDTAGAWVPRHFPNGRREGDEWRLANIKGDRPRKGGSCVIALKGERSGDWYDHDGGDGGGPLSTLEHATGLASRDLFEHAAQLVGWSPGSPARQTPPSPPPKEKDSRREIEIILSRTVPIPGTLAEAYLRSRGLKVPDGPDLHFHPDLTHWDSKMGFPALVGIVRNGQDDIIALQRIYLGPDGTAKAPVPSPKKMLGKVSGGAVRLGAIGADGRLGLCEGIETGLAVMTACPGLPVWAALSTSHLEQVVLPSAAREIVILADNDKSGAGARAAETIARKLRAEGRRVAICQPPEPDSDFNDLLVSTGQETVAGLVRAAIANMADATAPEPEMGRHLPHGFTLPASPLPRLRADEGDLSRAGNKAWSLLLAANRKPWLFRTGAQMSWVVPDDRGEPVAAPVTDERLRYMLARLAVWQKLNRNNELVPAHPPTGLVKSLLATPDPALPVLAGIVNTPVFGSDGTLLTEPGYHAEAKLLFHPAPGFTLPPIPACPSGEDVAQARALLLDDLLGDFPFVAEAERAHALSLLLLGFIRAMIDGPTPLHVIEKPTPGTGATLMVDAIATVLTGTGASVMTEGRDEEEWRKRLTAKLRQIPSLVVIDNLRHPLDSSALAAALTAPHWEDRILGASEMTRLPIRCVWIATGNNPEFSNEMARRVVRIRLEAHVDQPWRREGFRHSDLMGWVRANRARLVAACLTLIRAWIAAGRPKGTRMIGSYENWSRAMGGILEHARIEGFLGNLDEMLAAADGEGAVWRSFITAWWDRFGTAEVGTGDLFEVALICEPPPPLGSGGDRSQRTRLGRALGRLRDRVFDIAGHNLRVDGQGTYQGARRWKLIFEGRLDADFVNVAVNVVNVGERVNSNVHEDNHLNDRDNFESGERRERLPHPHAHACARTYVHLEDAEKRSRRSPRSPAPENSMGCGGERGGERCNQRPTSTDAVPDWLKEVQ